MDERGSDNIRSGAASRPPASEFTEDTPLFTDVPYTPVRRAGNSGRPEPTPSKTPPLGRSASGSGLYGGRPYSAPQRRDPAPRPAQSTPPRGRSRSAPVYTELSWDDLMRGTDPDQLGRPAQPAETPASFPSSSSPQPRSGSQYFGGFDQEMEELFYGRPARQSAPKDPRYRDPAPTDNASPRPAENIRPRTAAPSYRPQATRRVPMQQNNTPAPAQRAASMGVRSQWSGVFGGGPGAPASPPRPSAGTPAAARPSRSGPSSQGKGRRSSRMPRGKIPPLFLGGGLILVALLIFLIARLTGDSSSSPRPASVPAAVTTPVPAETSAPAVTPEPAGEATPAPTPEPTPTPSGPKAKKVGDLVVPADWGPTIPARSRAVYDSFFDKSIMVGNSLVEGYRNWAGMNNMRCIFHTGATVSNAIGNIDLAPITLNPPGYYENIYLMFGLNEIGTDVNSFVQGYKKLVDFIREYQPTANIVCISVTPVMKKVDEDPNEVQSMERIRRFNAALQEFCVDQNCWYLDIYNLLLDKDGYLSGEYAYIGDGKHFEKSGYVAWANYMKTHYVDEKLLTE